jgi:aminoglycoside phosphotransferase family enzyme/predicted kinase
MRGTDDGGDQVDEEDKDRGTAADSRVDCLAAAVHETHVGVVLLLGDRAYKLKKPVHTPFLDFSTPERRLTVLRRELDLNRRLAPDVYLGLAHVSALSPDGRAASAGPGEHVLVMRRMPAARRLATLVGSGADVDGELRALARLVAAFHAGAERGPEIAGEGGHDALQARWRANIAELRPYQGTVLAASMVDPASTVDAIEGLAMRFLDGRGPLFTDRIAHDRVIDGHGDLIAADVFCLDDGPRVLDCLEFDDRLRFVDGLDDVAFLAMDLERLGRPDAADRFLDAYVEFSGDPAPMSLRHHYIAYRAGVRAKVACLRHAQGDRAAADDAALHADIALQHLREGEVRLVLIGGLPGTGKTTLAAGLADRIGAVVLSSDRIRKELAGLDPTAPAEAGFREGIYSPERTNELYAELLHRAELLLARGESVVLDASWTSRPHRDLADDLAVRTHSRLIRLQCRTTAQSARHRIMSRVGDASDATLPVATAMATTADPWPEAVTIPTSHSAEESLELAASVWRGAR